MDLPERPFTGQPPFDAAAAINRKLDKIGEHVQKLEAGQQALLATLKETPGGDAEAGLSGSRYASYLRHLETELAGLASSDELQSCCESKELCFYSW